MYQKRKQKTLSFIIAENFFNQEKTRQILSIATNSSPRRGLVISIVCIDDTTYSENLINEDTQGEPF